MPGCVLSIFHVAPQRIGGVEVFARELTRQLSAAGWKSVVCFLPEPVDSVRRLLESAGAILDVAPDLQGPKWASARDLFRLLRRYRPDVLHISFGALVGISPWLARCCSVRRILLTDQNSRPEGYAPTHAPWWKRAIRRLLNRPVAGVIAVSDYVARAEDALGCVGSDRITRIYNGVDLSRPSGDGDLFRRKYSIPRDCPVVLKISWIIAEKGVLDFLDAAKLVLDVNPGVHFVIAGEGECRRQYMEYSVGLGIADSVTWTGLVEDPIAEGVFAAADIVCQLSRWEEAFGWVIAEAMARGKPVIAADCGGIPEVVEHGVTGFLIPRRRPAAVAQRIQELLRDAELRHRMGAAGRARAEALFDVRRNVADLLTIYGIQVEGRAAATHAGSRH